MPLDPVFSLDAVLHENLASYTKVFSIHDMEYFLWIKVSPEIAKHYRLYQIDEVGLENKFDFNTGDAVSHETGRIWYKINSMYLDRSAGQHVYRMHFVNIENETTISLYFSYIVQREDTDKSYVYMNHDTEPKVKL